MEANLCVETPVTTDVPRNTVKFSLCITGAIFSYNCAQSLAHTNSDQCRNATVCNGNADMNALCAYYGCPSECLIFATNELGLRFIQ